MLSTKEKYIPKGEARREKSLRTHDFGRLEKRVSVGEQGRSLELPHLGVIQVG